jgi:hypothetical protein
MIRCDVNIRVPFKNCARVPETFETRVYGCLDGTSQTKMDSRGGSAFAANCHNMWGSLSLFHLTYQTFSAKPLALKMPSLLSMNVDDR